MRQRALCRSEDKHDLCLMGKIKRAGKPRFIRLHKDAAATWLRSTVTCGDLHSGGLFFHYGHSRLYGREGAAAGERCWKGNAHSRSGVRHAVGMGMLADASRAAAIAGRDGRSAGVLWFANGGCAGVIITHSSLLAWWANRSIPASEMHQLNGPQERWRRCRRCC